MFELAEFFYSDYMPHGHCFLWLPGILWLTVGSDALIALSYFSIPIALLLFIRKRPDIEFRALGVLFAAFIMLCGMTHLFSIYTIWNGAYGVMAVMKAMTAAVSFITAIMTFRLIKPALAIPTPKQHEAALRETLTQQQEVERLNAEAKSDNLIRAAIDFLPAGMVIVNADGELVYVNNELERLFGYEAGELDHKNISCLILEIDQVKHAEHTNNYFVAPSDKVMARGRVVQGRTKNGEMVSVEVSLMPKKLNGEQYVFASVVGVNEVLNIEEKVVSHSTRLLRAINAADEGIWEWNVKTGDVWYSPRLLELIGVEASSIEYTLDDWMAHIHPDDKANVSVVLQDHFEKRTPYKVEYRGLNKSGDYEWMQARGEARFDSNGEPMFMSGTLVSVEETVELSEQLEEQVALNEELSQDFINTFELAAVGIAHVSLEGNWLRVNQQLCDIVGYSEGELLTLSFQEITHADDLDTDLAHVQELIEGGSDTYSMEKRYIHKQGHTVWINLTVSIVRYEDLKTKKQIPQYFISVIEDISKRKLIEQELESSNDELERFAYAASHDLQEPLRKISMFSASLQESLKEKIQDEKALYELDRIGDAALRMKSMVSSLMELSRAQRLEVRREVVSLETLVMQTKEQLETLIDETGASVELIRDNVSLFVDRVAMLHVLQNLISNAIRYCPITRAPRIEINANDSESGTEIELRIKDNAMGIAPELQNAAFEPFRRLVGKEIKGSGMGLSICKRIVERHGAQLSIESSNDTGTTFLICLPKS